MSGGRPKSSERQLVEHSYSVDIKSYLQSLEQSHLTPGSAFLPIAITWPDGKKISAQVKLVTTIPQYGGIRYWFACPKCARRVNRLCVPDGGVDLACRHCHHLAYWLQYRKTETSRFAYLLASGKLGAKELKLFCRRASEIDELLDKRLEKNRELAAIGRARWAGYRAKRESALNSNSPG
jgi:hypothetical protein